MHSTSASTLFFFLHYKAQKFATKRRQPTVYGNLYSPQMVAEQQRKK